MIRLAIVGCNYGRTVQLPAFRLDPRCEVVALAGSDAAKTRTLAGQAGIPHGFGDWRAMLDAVEIDAVAIATPPRLQSDIAIDALRRGKAVFAEKPLAADLAGAAAMLYAARTRTAMVDFNFTEVMAWRKARELLQGGAIGSLRHVNVSWQVENVSTRLRLKNWKTSGGDGGGALGNFASHTLHYLEWFGGPLTGLSARLSALPDDASFETGVTVAAEFRSGAAASVALSCAAFLGSGHRLEFYGSDGALVLANPGPDYMAGFTLHHAARPAGTFSEVGIGPDPISGQPDGRIAPVARLASRFLDAVERGGVASPGFGEGYRVQALLDAVRRSHAAGQWIDVRPEALQ